MCSLKKCVFILTISYTLYCIFIISTSPVFFLLPRLSCHVPFLLSFSLKKQNKKQQRKRALECVVIIVHPHLGRALEHGSCGTTAWEKLAFPFLAVLTGLGALSSSLTCSAVRT
uniref:Uncharacterized protein n=1 Tax=Mus musculus TaxID=10090 RepID=Q3U0W5_MOUSE|nr:unnamed protein product [Mus musculus]